MSKGACRSDREVGPVDSAATTWGVGDYASMAQKLEPAALAAVDAAAIRPGDRVVDVATGTGNAALLAAQRSGDVTGIDFEPALLEIAERKGRALQQGVRWLHGDAEELPLPNETANVVLSIFGVMYARDHVAAARELARVVAPRARVVLAAWTPGGFIPAFGQVVAPYLPSPPASGSPPSRWGDVESLRALLTDGGLCMTSSAAQTMHLTFPDAPAAATFLIHTAGHVLAERDHLLADGRWRELHDHVVALVDQRADLESDQLRLGFEYLLARARKP